MGYRAEPFLLKEIILMLKTKEYIESQNFQPDIVLIKLGTNDTKPQNWKYKDEFMADYQHLIDSYKATNYITDSYTLFFAGRIFDQCSINRESSMK